MEKSRITIEFTPGVSQAYPNELDFLRDYLPAVVAARSGYNMGSLARDLDLSPSNLSNKLSGNGDYDFGSKYRDRLKREYNEIDALKARIAELEQEAGA